MTILNVYVTPQRVLLCTDSEVATSDRNVRGERSKVLYLPHANVAIAGRGVQMFVLGLFEGAWMNLITTLDELENLWTNAALDAFRAQVLSQAQQNGVDLSRDAGGEVVAVGFSHCRDRMIALHYATANGLGFAKTVREQGVIVPECEPPYVIDTVDAMTNFARRQIAYWKARAPDEAFGGRLVIADLARSGAVFTTRPV